MRMRAVFYYRDPVPRTDVAQAVHIREAAVQMHGDDCPGSGRDQSFYLGWVDAVCARLDVGQHGNSVDVQWGSCRRLPGQSGHDDLVADSDVEGLERELQRHGPIGHAESVVRVLEGSEPALELGLKRPIKCPLTALHYFSEQLHLAACHPGPWRWRDLVRQRSAENHRLRG